MFSSLTPEERARRKLRQLMEKYDAQLKRGSKKVIGRYIESLMAKGEIPADRLMEIRKEVYDWQMERGIAKSEVGIKSFGQLESAASFRRSMFQQYQRNILATNPIRPMFEDKQMCYEFIDRLGVRRPHCTPIMQVEGIIAECRKGQDFPKYVVKPLSSCNSKGVYLVGSPTHIFRVKGGITLNSFEELEREMRADLAEGRVPSDEWFIEEAITIDDETLRPARDLKFFAFYGEIGVVAEIDRVDKAFVCWWTPEGKPTEGFRGFDWFEGDGFTKDELEYVRSISRKIPLPYARLDFLKNKKGDFVFGEIEVNTGGFEKFPRHTDKHLGECYLRAEQRLFWDVWSGKRYPDIEEVAKQLPAFAALPPRG